MSRMKLYNEAESLYIREELSPDEISDKIGVSRRTLYYWMAKYKWNDKKQEIKKSQKALSQDLFEFCKKLMRKIKKDIESAHTPNRAELYSLVNILKYLPALQKHESIAPRENSVKNEITAETIEKIQREILGI